MSKKFKNRPSLLSSKLPLWKWIVIIILVIGMPVLFMNYRLHQTARAIAYTETNQQK